MSKKIFCLIFSMIFILTLIPLGTVRAADRSIYDHQLWDEDQTIGENIVVGYGGHLEISGATITMLCTNTPHIEIQFGGRLTVDRATIQGDGSAGCWEGIIIQSSNNLSSITDSHILDAITGVSNRHSGTTITHNEIANLKGINGNPDDGGDAIGIRIEDVDELSAPTVSGNDIHHLYGGAAADGTEGFGGMAIGIYATLNHQMTFENNTIRHLYGGTGLNGVETNITGGYGGLAVGIKVDSSDWMLLENNTIEHLYGGTGASGFGYGSGGYAIGVDIENSSQVNITRNAISELHGGAGADGADGVSPGEDGSRGGSAGWTIGIRLNYTDQAAIEQNTIEELVGGACGDGGDGQAGANGSPGSESDPATAGGDGGDGGTAGHYGITFGMFINYDAQANRITGNTIRNLFIPDGCIGGNGDMGGAGGDGAPGDAENAPGDGAAGGAGGAGGSASYPTGMPFDVAGIVTNGNIAEMTTIAGNTIHNLYAANGGTGGAGGMGGPGGAGGSDTDVSALAGYPNGGNGGAGGPGGTGGRYGEGGDVGFTYFVTIDVEMLGNKIHTLVAGNAGPAGQGGDGGTGGPGGAGGTNLEGIAGNGGSGGPGGEPGAPQETHWGNWGGNATGVKTLTSSPNSPSATVANNDIWSLIAGQGANGSPGANGGDGGPGGDGGNGGSGGPGGLGADGGDGHPGGDNGTSEIIYTYTYTTYIVNNTLMDPTTPQTLSDGGAGGLGGSHGANGDPNGGGGGGSASDGNPGASGNSAFTYGIHHDGGEGNVVVVNNIIVNTIALPGSDSYSMADDAESEGHITVANNNHLAGWYAGEGTVNPGADLSTISLGPHTIDDPFFIGYYDHHLTGISPCLDAGDNSYAGLPLTDFDGKTRALDGNGDQIAIVDIGAYELGDEDLLFYIPLFNR